MLVANAMVRIVMLVRMVANALLIDGNAVMLTLSLSVFFVTLLGNILYSHIIHNVHGISW